MDVIVIDERIRQDTTAQLIELHRMYILDLYEHLQQIIHERVFMDQSLPINKQRQIALVRVSNANLEWTLQPPSTLAEVYRLEADLKNPLPLARTLTPPGPLASIPPFTYSTADILAEVMKVVGSARKLAHCSAFAPVTVRFLSPLVAIDYAAPSETSCDDVKLQSQLNAATACSTSSVPSAPHSDDLLSPSFTTMHGDARRLTALLRRMEAGHCAVHFIRPLHTHTRAHAHATAHLRLPLWLSSDVLQLSTHLRTFTRLLSACTDCTATLLRADMPSLHALMQYDDSTMAPRVLRILLPTHTATDPSESVSARYLALDCLVAAPYKPLPAIAHAALCHCHGAPLLYTTASPTTAARYCSVTHKRLRQVDQAPGLRVGAYSLMLPPTAADTAVAHSMRTEAAERAAQLIAAGGADADVVDEYALPSPPAVAVALGDLLHVRATATCGYPLTDTSGTHVQPTPAPAADGRVPVSANVEALAVATGSMPAAALSVGLLTSDVLACRPLTHCPLSVLNSRGIVASNHQRGGEGRGSLCTYSAVQQQGQSALWRAVMRALWLRRECLLVDTYEVAEGTCEGGAHAHAHEYDSMRHTRVGGADLGAGASEDVLAAVSRLRNTACDGTINASVRGDVSGVARYGSRQRYALMSDGHEAVLLRVPCAEEVASRHAAQCVADSAMDAAALHAMGVCAGDAGEDAGGLVLSSLLAALPSTSHAAASAYSSGAREEVGRVLRASGVGHMGYTVGVRWASGADAEEEVGKKPKKRKSDAVARDGATNALVGASSPAPTTRRPAAGHSPPHSPIATLADTGARAPAASAPASFQAFARPAPPQPAFAVHFGAQAAPPANPNIYIRKNAPVLPAVLNDNSHPNSTTNSFAPSGGGARLYRRKG